MGLRVFLLGRFEVWRDDAPIPPSAWRRRRPADLLKRMALAPGRTLAREQLIDELWPDKDPETGANNLHRALHDLRQTLGGRYVAPDKGVVRMAPDVWVDVSAFEELASQGEASSLAAAVEYYRGDLCPDDPYGDLLDAFRRGLRARFLDIGLHLGRQRMATGDDVGAIDTLRRVLAIEPGHEEAHRGLIQSLARTGRRVEALAQYDACLTALRALGLTPASQTAALQRAIAQGEIGPQRHNTAAPWLQVARRLLGTSEPLPLRGRERELKQLSEFLAGSGGSLWLVGEPGVGKTRLAVEAARSAQESGATVLCGVCLDHETRSAYAPFLEMWTHHLRSAGLPSSDNPFFVLAQPRLAGSSDAPPRTRDLEPANDLRTDQLQLFEAVERALQDADRVGLRSPLLILDDLQLADRSSLDLCRHLIRTSAAQRLHFLLTCREEALVPGAPLQQLYTELARQRLARRVSVQRLDAAATHDVLADILETAPEANLGRAIYELTGGNAFYTEELARAVRDHVDAFPTQAGAALDLATLLPEDLTEVVRERVAQLGRETESLLVSASVMGQRFGFDVAARVAGMSVTEGLSALEKAIAAGLVEETEGSYAFRHALVRESLYRALTRARRVHLHARTAEVLEAQLTEDQHGASANAHGQIARHFHDAGAPKRALVHLIAAGDHAARRTGLRDALWFYEEALTAQPQVSERYSLLLKLGRIDIALSELDRAVDRFDQALSLEAIEGSFHASAEERARARLGAARALISAGRFEAAGDRLDAATRDLGGLTSGHPELSIILYHLSLLRWNQARFDDAIALAQQCLVEADRHGDPRAQSRAHEALVMAAHALGDWRLGVEHEAKRQALVGPTLEAGEMFEVHLCLWELHLYDGQGRLRARQMLESTEQRASDIGAKRIEALCKCVGGSLAFLGGSWRDAEARFRLARELYCEVGAHIGHAEAQQRLGSLLTAEGRLDEARSELAEGFRAAERSRMRLHIMVRLYAAKARVELAAGDLKAAREAIEQGLENEERNGRCMTCTLLLQQERVRIGLARQDFDDAESATQDLERIAERFRSASWRGMARLARARVLSRRGARAEAEQAFREAMAAYLEAGCAAEVDAVQREASALP